MYAQIHKKENISTPHFLVLKAFVVKGLRRVRCFANTSLITSLLVGASSITPFYDNVVRDGINLIQIVYEQNCGNILKPLHLSLKCSESRINTEVAEA